MNREQMKKAIDDLYNDMDAEVNQTVTAFEVGTDALNALTGKVIDKLTTMCDNMEEAIQADDEEVAGLREENDNLNEAAVRIANINVALRDGLRDVYELLDPEVGIVDGTTIEAAKNRILEVLAMTTDSEETACDRDTE